MEKSKYDIAVKWLAAQVVDNPGKIVAFFGLRVFVPGIVQNLKLLAPPNNPMVRYSQSQQVAMYRDGTTVRFFNADNSAFFQGLNIAAAWAHNVSSSEVASIRERLRPSINLLETTP